MKQKQNKITQQVDFSSVLFDSLFGLILFFSMDSFLDITDPVHFIFYLFTTVILVHWWLLFKCSEDLYGQDVNNSITDMVLGLGFIVFLEFAVLYARDFDYIMATWALLGVFVLDIIWTMLWRYVGKWEARDPKLISSMQNELDISLRLIILMIVLTVINLGVSKYLNAWQYLILFMLDYCVFIWLTFKYKLIDLDIF